MLICCRGGAEANGGQVVDDDDTLRGEAESVSGFIVIVSCHSLLLLFLLLLEIGIRTGVSGVGFGARRWKNNPVSC